jgi:PASTA domain
MGTSRTGSPVVAPTRLDLIQSRVSARGAVVLALLSALLLVDCANIEDLRDSQGAANGMDPATAVTPRLATDRATRSWQPMGESAGRRPGDPGPSGPPAAIVPDVRGMAFADAVSRLWQVGIDFRAVYARGSSRPLWSVIHQTPAPGGDTPDSGAIDLILSFSGRGGSGAIRCGPLARDLTDPFCVGKLLRY